MLGLSALATPASAAHSATATSAAASAHPAAESAHPAVALACRMLHLRRLDPESNEGALLCFDRVGCVRRLCERHSQFVDEIALRLADLSP